MNALVRGLICCLLILAAVPSPAADFAMKREPDRLVVIAPMRDASLSASISPRRA